MSLVRTKCPATQYCLEELCETRYLFQEEKVEILVRLDVESSGHPLHILGWYDVDGWEFTISIKIIT